MRAWRSVCSREPLYLIDGLRRIGMPNKFRIQIPRMVWRLQRKSEIVHREDIFQEFGFLEVANAAGLARRVELVGQRVGARIEIMIVSATR